MCQCVDRMTNRRGTTSSLVNVGNIVHTDFPPRVSNTECFGEKSLNVCFYPGARFLNDPVT